LDDVDNPDGISFIKLKEPEKVEEFVKQIKTPTLVPVESTFFDEKQDEQQVPVLAALRRVFDFKQTKNEDKLEAWVLCRECGEKLETLYTAFEEFRLLTHKESLLAKRIRKVDREREGDNSTKSEGKEKGEVHFVLNLNDGLSSLENTDDEDENGRCRRRTRSSRKNRKLLDDFSSDSNSLSDLNEENNPLEIEAKGEKVSADVSVKRRISTRPRATKKPPSDYEQLESSEVEDGESNHPEHFGADNDEDPFEDDEEDDPNFDAKEECK